MAGSLRIVAVIAALCLATPQAKNFLKLQNASDATALDSTIAKASVADEVEAQAISKAADEVTTSDDAEQKSEDAAIIEEANAEILKDRKSAMEATSGPDGRPDRGG